MLKIFTRIICLLLLLGAGQAKAQFTDFMWHRGYMIGQTTLPSFNYFPDSATSQNFPFVDSTSQSNRRAIQFGLNWGARVNLYNFDDEKSISLHADVIASLYINGDFLGDTDFGEVGTGIQIPLVVNFNTGHMATKNSTANKGFAVGLGVELNNMQYDIGNPNYDGYWNYDRTKVEVNRGFWAQPVLNLGYKYWRDDVDARELNLQIGWGYVDRLTTGSNFRPNVRLSLHRFINY